MGWLRAAVLGANDGIVSTASLVVGVAAAGTGRADVLVAGVARTRSGSRGGARLSACWWCPSRAPSSATG